MKKTMKCMIALAFAMTMLCSLVANAAMPESEIMPLYNFIDDTECTIEINGTKAVMTAFVSAAADRCQIKMTLQMQNDSSWDDVTSWTVSEDSNSLSLRKSYTIDSSESYRVKATFKVWNGSSTETVTKTALP